MLCMLCSKRQEGRLKYYKKIVFLQICGYFCKHQFYFNHGKAFILTSLTVRKPINIHSITPPKLCFPAFKVKCYFLALRQTFANVHLELWEKVLNIDWILEWIMLLVYFNHTLSSVWLFIVLIYNISCILEKMVASG